MGKIVVVNSEIMGSGSIELGQNLMGSFLRKIVTLENKPDAIIFYNSGVRLLVEGSLVLDAIDSLFKVGVDIIACGTCIGYFNIEDKIVIGRVSNMQEIASLLLDSESVVNI